MRSGRGVEAGRRGPALAVLALAVLAHGGAGAQPPSSAAELSQLHARELQLQLATGDAFYLELDPAGRMLRLKLAGVDLRTYPLQEVDLRLPRVTFLPVERPRDWGLRIWSGAKLDPTRPLNRLEVKPAAGDSTTDTLAQVVKLLLEGSALPKVPWEYRIRFEGGMTLAVMSPPDSGGVRLLSRLHGAWKDVCDVLANRRLQLRLQLARADAEHLFRTLPPETKLLVLSVPRRAEEPQAGPTTAANAGAARPARRQAPPAAAMPGPERAELTPPEPAPAPPEPAPAPPESAAVRAQPEPAPAGPDSTAAPPPAPAADSSRPGEDSAPAAPAPVPAPAAPDSAAPDSAAPPQSARR